MRFRLVDDVLHVGRLTVAPDRQRAGIGGRRSEGNLRLYARCGDVEVRREPVHERLVLVHLEKELRG